MSAPTAPEVADEFQRRRALVWRKLRHWVVAGSAAGIWLASQGERCFTPGVIEIVGFGVLGVAIVATAFIVRRYYRCPVCDSVPQDEGVLINPSSCPKCGALLR